MLNLRFLGMMFKVIKIFYLIFFYVIYSFTDIVLILIAIFQTLCKLFGDGPSQSLQRTGQSLGLYVKQISEYLSYATEQKPYPFSDWPEPEAEITAQKTEAMK